ncbi:MAG: hypothetical protein BMS9Abin17_0461 [Acidimicrobiia bacterium]|nr:MAG: hypothetical protein BMS9Abin17_0461 [Acidimicrobiia bacterium]
MIGTAYLRAYISASQLGPLPPHREVDRIGAITQNDRFLWEESLADDAFYAMWEGKQFACPRNVQVRMIEGILAFSNTYPTMPLLSEDERIEYNAELGRLRSTSHHARGHILSSAWHVPLRWFSAFRSSEREVYDGVKGKSVRYRTSAGDAVDRVRWAKTVLEGAGFADQVIERVGDLERWISEFSADTMIELDYGSAARTFPDAELVFDESADEVRTSLLALEAGDFAASRNAYETVARRWAAAQSSIFSN